MIRTVKSAAKSSDPNSPAVQKVLGSAGQPLEQATREFMEPRFAGDFARVPVRASIPPRELVVGASDDPAEHAADGAADQALSAGSAPPASPPADFSQVRVHSGLDAAEAAAAVGARAFAVGHDLVFGAGEYQPHSGPGRRLLAHELAHVTQQAGATALQRATIRRATAPAKGDDIRESHPVTIPAGITTRKAMIRYAELQIFGQTTPIAWESQEAGAKTAIDDPAQHVGETVNFLVSRANLKRYKLPGGPGAKAADDKVYAGLDADTRTAVDVEIGRRYTAGGGTTETAGKGRTAQWNVFRRKVLADKGKLDALPEAIKSLFSAENFAPSQFEALVRVTDKLSRLSADVLADYEARTGVTSDDLAEFEKSLDSYLADKAERDKADLKRGELVHRLDGARGLYATLKRLGLDSVDLDLPSSARTYQPVPEAEAVRHQEFADFRADLQAHNFSSIAEFAQTLDAYEKVFLVETAAFGQGVVQRLEHQLLQAEQQYSNDGAVDALIAAARATSAPLLRAQAGAKKNEAHLIPREDFDVNEDLDRADRAGRADPAQLYAEANQLEWQADEQIRALPGQPLLADKGFPRDILLSGDRASVKAAIRAYIAERRGNAATARANLQSSPDLVYGLPELVGISLSQQHIAADSVEKDLVTDRLRSHVVGEAVFGATVALLAFALTAATAGAGVVVVAAVATGTELLDAYQFAEEYQKYEAQKAFADVGLADEPGLAWMFVAVAAGGHDLVAADRAIKKLPALQRVLSGFDHSKDVAALAEATLPLEKGLRQSILDAAVAKIRATEATEKLVGGAASLNSLGRADIVPDLLRAVYNQGKRIDAGISTIIKRIETRRTLLAAAMTVEEKAQVATNLATVLNTVKDVRAAGKAAGLTEKRIGEYIERMAENPGLTVKEVQAEMAAATRGKAPVDVGGQLAATRRIQGAKEAQGVAAAEMRAEGETSWSLLRQLQAHSAVRPVLPASLRPRFNAIHRLSTPEEKLSAFQVLRADKGLTAEEKAFAGWATENAELQVRRAASLREGVETGREAGVEAGNEVNAHEELRVASRSVYDIIRENGPNYRAMQGKVKYDEVMGAQAWEELARTKQGLGLSPDHLVPVDQVAQRPELAGLLDLYKKAPAGMRAQLDKDLKSLADDPFNLVGLRSDFNANVKNNKSWREIPYQVAKEYGYTTEMVDVMRAREIQSLRMILERMEALAAEYRTLLETPPAASGGVRISTTPRFRVSSPGDPVPEATPQEELEPDFGDTAEPPAQRRSMRWP